MQNNKCRDPRDCNGFRSSNRANTTTGATFVLVPCSLGQKNICDGNNRSNPKGIFVLLAPKSSAMSRFCPLIVGIRQKKMTHLFGICQYVCKEYFKKKIIIIIIIIIIINVYKRLTSPHQLPKCYIPSRWFKSLRASTKIRAT